MFYINRYNLNPKVIPFPYDDFLMIFPYNLSYLHLWNMIILNHVTLGKNNP